MRVLGKLTWVEVKLFLREPITVLFALALPLTVLFVLGGVFGNQGDPSVYRGVGPMDYYVPAYVAFVAAAVGLISLPMHLASNRERGVLKRYHASGVPAWAVAASQVMVMVVISTVSSLVLVAAAAPAYYVSAPDSIGRVVLGFALTALAFAGVGVLLGAVLPSARGALALGVLIWFVLLMLGGPGPPPEVLSETMRTVGELTPLRHAVNVLHDGWLGLDPGDSWWVVAGVALGSSVLALRFFHWE